MPLTGDVPQFDESRRLSEDDTKSPSGAPATEAVATKEAPAVMEEASESDLKVNRLSKH